MGDVAEALRVLNAAAGHLQWKVLKQVADWRAKADAVQADEVTPVSYRKLQNAIAAADTLDATSTHDEYVAALARLVWAYERLVDAK